ncbi:plexin-A4-like [Planococcus citri]|uniref:plexin-A4-like n=1 Tax=Planococcus citri TaxID=170843 RepID=UPI0031F81788
MHLYSTFSLIWFVYTASLFLKSIANASSDNPTKYFLRESDELKFNHMVVYSLRDWVFIGAVNRLYQLDSNLKVVRNWTTGPENDCKYSWNVFYTRTDNHNKMLLLDYINSQLLLCGSVSPPCKIYRIEGTPSKTLKSLCDIPVADVEMASVVAFIAPNSRHKCLSRSWWFGCKEYGTLPVLHVGIKYMHQEHQSKASALARADLRENTLIKVAKKTLENEYKENYISSYVHGFSSGSYNYFLTTEINAAQPSKSKSKLMRINLDDENYSSYTEIYIECHDDKGTEYNLAKAAFVGMSGSQLANSLNIKLEDDVLFGIFARSEQQTMNNDDMKKVGNKTALCIYPLKTIDNMTLDGKSPVKEQATAVFNTSVKAIIATPHPNGFTVAFLGTNDGHLIQIGVKNKSTMCRYGRITIDEGYAINSDLHFDQETDNLYTLTERKLTKVKIPFPAPSISTLEPRTGLTGISMNITIEGDNLGCTFEDIQNISVAGKLCTPYKHLYESLKKIVCLINITSKERKPYEGPVDIHVNGLFAKSIQNLKIFDPIIENIFPKEGSVHGGTELTITGQHFETEGLIRVSIGNISCEVLYYTQSVIKCVTQPSIITNDKVIVKFGKYYHLTNHSYKYTNDTDRDRNGYNLAPKGIPAGGIIISIHNNIGQNFLTIQEMIFQVKYNGHTYNGSKCLYINTAFLMRCFSPHIQEIDSNSISSENPRTFNYTLLIKHNGTNATSRSIQVNSSTFLLYPNPKFNNFSIFEYAEKVRFEIKGRNIDNACQKSDFNVRVGNDNCSVITLCQSDLVCEMQKKHPTVFAAYENVIVQIGNNLNYTVPKAKQDDIPNQHQIIIHYLKIVGLSVLVFIISAFACTCFIYRRNGKSAKKQMQERINRLELCVAAECREAFAELQTKMLNSVSENITNNLPFLDYRTFVMKNAFPNLDDHSIILSSDPTLLYNNEPLQLLGELIHNKTFLLIFIQTMEGLDSFSMNDRIYFASMLMIALQNKMEYCTDILETLLADLIKKYIQGKTHPKLLLRQSGSIVEKMLSTWFTFLLYEFLTEFSGEPLFKLFKAIKQQIYKGPVDMITYEARYSLNEEKLIRQCIDYHPITVHVNVSHKDASIIGFESAVEMKPVSVLDCDTISQVKEKILETLCPNIGFSKRPQASTFNLKLSTSATTKYSNLQDDDTSSKTERGWKQKNTLLHYGVQDGAKLTLVPIEKTMNRQTSFDSVTGKPKMFRLLSSSFDSRSSLIRRKNVDVDHNNIKEWHLVKPNTLDDDSKDRDGFDKMVSEIYLTRLLATKGTLQHFVDDLFKDILNQESQIDCFPMAIKFMFDFLDYQAFLHGVTDPEVVHAWKSNCLPLRFWVNLIKNPNFLFDVHKSEIVDSCLSVVAQAFMDSFSTAEHNLGKNSPTSKLLYAKDIPFYKQWVQKYYAGIQSMPAVSREDMNKVLENESLLHANDFNTNEAMHKLYRYIVKYNDELMTALKKDQSPLTNSLAQKLEEVNRAISINKKS